MASNSLCVIWTIVGLLNTHTHLAVSDESYVQAETRLHKDLLATYNSDVRPAIADTDSVRVELRPQIVRLEDVDEGIGTLRMTIAMFQTWSDPRLIWDPATYGSVKDINIPLEAIWKPDIVLYNGPPDEASGYYDQLVRVYYNGTVVFVPFMSRGSYCGMDMSAFPNDQHTCVMTFGSWGYSSGQLHLAFFNDENTNTTVDVFTVRADNEMESKSKSHPAWDIVGKTATANIRSFKFDCCDDPYSLMEMSVTLKRTSPFFQYIVVNPAIVLAILVPLQFLLPVTSSLRTSFGLLILLCYTLLLFTLQSYFPMEHSSVPALGLFYVDTMIFAALAVVISSVISGIAAKGKSSLPAWANNVFLGRCGFGRFMCVDTSSPPDDRDRSANRGLLTEVEDPAIETISTADPEQREFEDYNKPLEVHLRNLANASRVVAMRTVAEGAIEQQNSDWKDFARVLDRMFFFVFVIMFIISLFSLVL